MDIPNLNAAMPVVFADKTMEPHFRDFLLALLTEVRSLRADLETAETAIADHEARITVLEP